MPIDTGCAYRHSPPIDATDGAPEEDQMLTVTNSRGQRIAEPTTGSHPDEDAGSPICGFGCGREVEDEGQTCASCLTQQEEKAAENDDPASHYADLQVDQDRLDGVRP